jgi:hypothetical protein
MALKILAGSVFPLPEPINRNAPYGFWPGDVAIDRTACPNMSRLNQVGEPFFSLSVFVQGKKGSAEEAERS